MHEQGIAHMDIRPANIGQRHDDGTMVLLDWETAVHVAECRKAPRGGVLGTLRHVCVWCK